MKLTYSAVQHPEFVGYLALLQPSSLQIEEIVGPSELSLDGEKDAKSIALKLATLATNPLIASAPSAAEDTARFEQVYAFAYDRVQQSMTTGHPELSEIFEILNEMLKLSTFLAGNRPTAADAFLFSLLHSRIRALIPSNQRRFFRVIRWFAQLQHDLVKTGEQQTALPLAAFDLKALESNNASSASVSKDLSKLSLAEAKEAKKKKQQEKNAKAAEPAPNVSLPPIARVDLRVGKIVHVEKHPNADRLYIEKVDFGEPELRVVVSGLVEHVPMEELQDRKCMFICNLKPATICKVQSSAMLLVAKNDSGLQPLIIPDAAKPGDRICVAGVEAQPDAVIKPAKEPQLSVWDEVRKDLRVDESGVAKFGDAPLLVSGQPVHSTQITNGIIS